MAPVKLSPKDRRINAAAARKRRREDELLGRFLQHGNEQERRRRARAAAKARARRRIKRDGPDPEILASRYTGRSR